MRMTLTIAATLLMGAFVYQPAVAQEPAAETAEQAAAAAAAAWLELMDTGEYAESWRQASEPFRSAVTEEAWVQQGAAVAGQTGGVAERTLAEAQYAPELPDAPEGEYVIVTYSSAFANVPSAEEVVVLMNEDGDWRVAGYFVRPG